MKDYPHRCEIASPSHFGGKPSDYDATPEPIRVSIRSSFTRGELLRARLAVARERGELEREKFFVWLESLPLIGRLFAHDTVLYWDQLDRVAVAPCKWTAS